ncbi:MAG: UDP-3-O-(3-hydroxymyristoyl)glucosamine N-acyltransferase [Spirochaeta sp.]|nr:UDP-3-O-(3-hydroxymyristoyl)glucosamine N-acyltransferase [Spirochaeta sp.]
MSVATKTPITVADLASGLGRVLEGDDQTRITGVSALDTAGPEDIAFVRSDRFQAAALESRAGAVILPEGMGAAAPSLIRSPNPAFDFAKVVTQIVAVPALDPSSSAGFHCSESAEVDPTCVLAQGVSVGAGSKLGARTRLHPGVVVYPHVIVGEDCVIHAGCILREGTRIGDRVILQPGVVIGGDGFGYVADDQGRPYPMPHVGGVQIESDVEIGSLTSVDRGTLGDTVIRCGAKIDNQVQIAHNCEIGERAMIAAQCGLSGSTKIGSGAVLMGGVGSAGHLTVGERAFVGARTGLHKDVSAGSRVYGFPQQSEWAWHRTVAALNRLPDWLRRLRAVEGALAESTEHSDPESTKDEE